MCRPCSAQRTSPSRPGHRERRSQRRGDALGRVLLKSELKGKGAGLDPDALIIEYAKSEGLKAISGDVLAENTVMLAMCRSLGFEVKSDQHGICNVRLTL